MPTSTSHSAPHVTPNPSPRAAGAKDAPFPVDPQVTNPRGPVADATTHVWEALRGSIAELRENVGYLLSTQIDGLKLMLRRAVLLIILGVVGLIALASAVIMSVVMVLRSIAGGLDVAMQSTWAGGLIVGAAILIVLTLGIWLSMRWLTGASRRATVARYESRLSQQRARFGRDVEGHSDAT